MNPDTIALLCADSLAATLTAARGRRVRRRTGVFVLTSMVLGVVALSVFPRRTPAPAVVTTSQPADPPAVFHRVPTIHTAPGAFTKITTRDSVPDVRFTTASASRVERIDNAGLARCFPDKGIAVIQAEGELAKVVFF